ncbi:MAG: hypothetical protein IPP87_19125 [Ideonella sp.]|jgi:hypothetical protein|nr:hypothetical protein [Ideonella sp.]MBL0150675.1 hypothetical protein [Ideonella sp.]
MTNTINGARRTGRVTSASLVALALTLALAAGLAGPTAWAAAEPGALPSDAEGFAFLAGHWRVQHRKLKDPLSGTEEWNEFDGSATFMSLVDGVVSVEELRDAQGKPFGGAMRTFDRERRVWSDSWVGVRDGVLQPGVIGRFNGPVGTFTTPDTYKDLVILARGVWRRLSPDEVTWEQFFSRDDGQSWQLTWHMRFVRTGGPSAGSK